MAGITSVENRDRRGRELDDHRRHPVDPRPVARSCTAGVAVEDALEDAGELPVTERHVEVESAHVASGRLFVAGLHLGTAREACKCGRCHAGDYGALPGLVPIDHQESEVRHRIPQGADLPVEDRSDLTVLRP